MNTVKTALYLSLLLAITSCSEKQTVQDHLLSAEKYQAENKLKESEISLKNAIKLDPSNAEARFQFGRLYLSQGAALNALKELEKAQSLKYNNNKLLPLLARAYLISDDFDGVLSLSEKSEPLPIEGKVEYLSYKTLAAIRTNQLDIAKQSSQQADELLSGSHHAILAKAYISMLDNDVTKAEAFVEKSLQIKDDNPEALMLQGQIYTRQQKFEEASKSYKKYAELQPQSKIIYLVLADTLVKTESYLEAEKYADLILKVLPNQPVANYVKSVVRFAEKDYALAQEFAEKSLASNYRTPHLSLVAGASAFYLNNFEQANVHLEPIVDKLVSDHPARKMFAVSQFQLGLIDDITETLGDFTPKNEIDEQFISSLSFNLYSIGATEDAKKIAGKITEQASEDASINARQGMLKLMMNDPSGVDNLEQAIADNPEMMGAKLAIAYAAMQSGDFDRALSITKEWQEHFPEKVGGFNMLAAIYSRKGEYTQAIEALSASLEKAPDNLFAVTEMAKMHYKQGDNENAQRYAEKGITLFPENIKALRYYFTVFKSPEALERIVNAYQNKKENIELKLLYMGALAEFKEFKTLLEISKSAPDSIKTPKKIWQLRLLAYQRLQQGANIKATLDEWKKVNPYHVEPIFLLADYYYKARQPQQALDVIDKALNKHHKDNTNLKMVKMQLLLDNRMVEPAKALLTTLDNDSINESVREGINGRIFLLEGNFQKAQPLLNKFYQEFPSSQNVILLTVALQETNKKSQAIDVLEKHLKNNEKAHNVRNLLASLYVSSDKNKALEQYQTLVESQPLNVVALNNLAWLYMENGKLEQALINSTKAYEFAPKVPNIADTYSQVLLKLDRKREALEKSKEAYELSKMADVDIALNYIEILMINSRMNEAKSILSTVKPTTTAQKTKTKMLLNKI
ncbi:XrtA/PEP-CTERM system TPR-repeat protein PrsT [Colwelliaceae bacterium 6441]